MIRHTARLSIIILLGTPCIGQTLVTEETEGRARFALSAYGGLTFGSTNWYFVRDDEQYPVYPSLTIGGGLRWRATQALEVAFFLDDWITTADMRVTLPSGNRNGIPAPYKMTGVGLRCLVHL